ncbi:hypothetical protein FNZ56_06485 [Pseudoluteimonas lycopersici]|uniref:Uncharacterized protein n=1 Tax=Pseudoluteimonas lycopersici TaxID=1324796 RepID=A0A516V4U5_9GAMM|nr:hypothetical protein [Lysobacter lycopersici]QDQ73543.1 hypothetical protein FNZ56_06485 [Lysobacter lycopersici]
MEIAKVELLSNGQVAVSPTVADGLYQYIYRAAAGVEWVAEEGRFLSPSRYMAGAPFPLTAEQRFHNLASAASSELGIRPKVSASTAWVGVPTDVRRSIEAAYSS